MFRLLILAFAFVVSTPLWADHMAGGHFEYEYIATNEYKIKFYFFRDCEGIDVSPPSLYRESVLCGYSCENLGAMDLISVNDVDYGCGATCDDPGSLKGYELYLFEKLVTLPEACSDWKFSVNIGARNIVEYASGGFYFNYIMINNLGGVINNSPTFSDMSVALGCRDQYAMFQNEHSDSEGDYIEFYMAQPQTDGLGDECNNSWIEFTPPDGYEMSSTNPYPTSSGAFDFDPESGEFGFVPAVDGSSYFALMYREFRDGVLITESYRDGQILVSTCPPVEDITIGNWDDTDYSTIEVERGEFPCHEIIISGTETIENIFLPNLPEGCSYSVSGIGSTTVTVQVCIDFISIDANCEDLLLDFDLVAASGGCYQNSMTSKHFEIVISPVEYCKTNRFFTNRNETTGLVMPEYAIASERIWVGDDMPGISGIDPAEMGNVVIQSDLTLVAGIEVIIPACVTGESCVTMTGGYNQTIIIQPNSCSNECPYDTISMDVQKVFECGEEKIAVYVESGVPPYSYIWRDIDGNLLSTSAVFNVHDIVSELYWDTPLELTLLVEDAAGDIGEWAGEIHGTKRFYEPVTNNTIYFEYPDDFLYETGYYYAGQPGVSYERPFFIADSVNLTPPWYGATEIDLIVWDRWDAGMGEPGEVISATLYDNSWDINGTTDWSLDNAEVYWNGFWNNDRDTDCPGSSPEIWVYQIKARNCLSPAEEPDDWEHVELSALIKYDCYDDDWTPNIDVTMAPVVDDEVATATRDVSAETNFIKENGENDLLIVPNPANEYFQILGSERWNVEMVIIYDLAGNQVKLIEEKTEIINISDLSSGTYIVKIIGQDQTTTEELIIQ